MIKGFGFSNSKDRRKNTRKKLEAQHAQNEDKQGKDYENQ